MSCSAIDVSNGGSSPVFKEIVNPTKNEKREGYIKWEELFMFLAKLASKRSKDPSTQVGSVVVNKENSVIGMGYNGMPSGCCENDLSWKNDAKNEYENKYPYVCHAVMNAITFVDRKSDIEGATVYSTLFPCIGCAKYMIHAKVAKLVYLDERPKDKEDNDATKALFKHLGIVYEKYQIIQKDQLKLEFKYETGYEDPGLGSLPSSPVKQIVDTSKKDVISWEELFMFMALLTAERSKDPVCQVGAVIINPDYHKDNSIVSIGYNSMPFGCNDDEMPWGKSNDKNQKYNTKSAYVCHAEVNAIWQIDKKAATRDGIMYTTLCPCNDCAKIIIQNSIKKVVYLTDRDTPPFQAAKVMFKSAGIECRRFKPVERKDLTLDLRENFKNDMSRKHSVSVSGEMEANTGA